MTEQGKAIGGARLDRAIADNYTGRGSSERTDMLPAGFVRYEYSMADVPVMLYAGVGYTERFPDYWELFSPTYGTDGSSDVFDKVKTEKTTQLDVGAQYSGKRLNGWVSAYVGRIDDFILFRYSANNARISQAEQRKRYRDGRRNWRELSSDGRMENGCESGVLWAQNTDNNSPLPQIPPLEARLSLSWERGGWSSTGLLRLVSAQHRVAINEGNVAGKDFDSSAGFAIFFSQRGLSNE